MINRGGGGLGEIDSQGGNKGAEEARGCEIGGNDGAPTSRAASLDRGDQPSVPREWRHQCAKHPRGRARDVPDPNACRCESMTCMVTVTPTRPGDGVPRVHRRKRGSNLLETRQELAPVLGKHVAEGVALDHDASGRHVPTAWGTPATRTVGDGGRFSVHRSMARSSYPRAIAPPLNRRESTRVHRAQVERFWAS